LARFEVLTFSATAVVSRYGKSWNFNFKVGSAVLLRYLILLKRRRLGRTDEKNEREVEKNKYI
jgi:hypothetical protein